VLGIVRLTSSNHIKGHFDVDALSAARVKADGR